MGTSMPIDQRKPAALVTLADIRGTGIDDLSDIRHLHASAFRAHGGALYTDREAEAFVRQVYSKEYADRIIRSNCHGAWVDGYLAGTCGWCTVGEERTTARISDVFVSPLFAGAGLGHMLVRHAEAEAREAGFNAFTLRAGYHAVGLFEALGYATTSQGVCQLADEVSMPVVFMRKSAESIECR